MKTIVIGTDKISLDLDDQDSKYLLNYLETYCPSKDAISFKWAKECYSAEKSLKKNNDLMKKISAHLFD